MTLAGERTPVLYLAPWVDLGGSDKGTIDWFRWLDRDRYAPSLITTQPSANRRIGEVAPYAEEVWSLPTLFEGRRFAPFILDFIESRGVRVLHVMNSRLGYDLLPDLLGLPSRPSVVVQLHVEEQDRSGYVRYVTTRYGNLVDCFSVTSHHLARAVEQDYVVLPERIRVIHTGVDAEREFSPDHVEPVAGLDPGAVHVLYLGRLAEQKDPQLMVEVVARLAPRVPGLQVHVVGDGHLEDEVRALVAERGLTDVVRFHGPTSDPAPWYAACDVVLLTSVFEGVPYVVYEALAMGVPVVAPSLPGTVELMADGGGVLVDPRDDVDAYVEALAGLAADPARRRAIGDAARARMRADFSLRRMGEEHARLYDDLLGSPRASRPRRQPRPSAGPLGFPDRPTRGTPRVSVVIPHFNQGTWLRECLASIAGQTYPDVETIVVDDCSTDPGTRALLEELDGDPAVEVVRMEVNGGPGAARNAGFARATGRYFLPVDSDNLLLPDAVAELVTQLQEAPANVGFVYPNLQFFGNRDDYFEAPAYDLHTLLQLNYCDTCSLLDRSIYDAGVRFADTTGEGHEDWDYALELAGRRVEGEPSRTKTLLYRKHGFTRSDRVEFGHGSFRDVVADRHRYLFAPRQQMAAKARVRPALSILATAAVEPDGEGEARLTRHARAQTCGDFELLVPGAWPAGPPEATPHLRGLPAGLAELEEGLLPSLVECARGALVLLVEGTGTELLADPGFVEKLLRLDAAHPEYDAVALVGADAARELLLAPAPTPVTTDPHAILWRSGGLHRPTEATVGLARFAARLARTFAVDGARLQWRAAAAPAVWPEAAPSDAVAVPVALREGRGHDAAPVLPRASRAPGRWTHLPYFMPAETLPLVRFRWPDGRREVASGPVPHGAVGEWPLGAARLFSPPGTVRVIERPDGAFRQAVPGTADARPGADEREVCTLETAAFPLLDPLLVVRIEDRPEHTLVNGVNDPLLPRVAEVFGTAGFIEAMPTNPQRPEPCSERPFDGLVGLLRGVDRTRRRHVVAAGAEPAGAELAGELGALLVDRRRDTVPVWIVDGVLHAEALPDAATPGLLRRAKFVAAPLRWRHFGRPKARARSVGRRALDVVRAGGGGPGGALPDTPAGYLWREGGGDRVPLYVASHPVTGDRLVTPYRLEAQDMGYVDTVLVGHLQGRAPVTGRIGLYRLSIPWVSRFGLDARHE